MSLSDKEKEDLLNPEISENDVSTPKLLRGPYKKNKSILYWSYEEIYGFEMEVNKNLPIEQVIVRLDCLQATINTMKIQVKSCKDLIRKRNRKKK